MACFSCCPPSPVQVTLCAADSVSHVKVISRRSNNDNVYESDIIYDFEHVEIYKKPLNFSTLPSVVYAPSPHDCGLQMEVGEEYLLAGNREGHQIRVFLCGQVYDGFSFGAPQWDSVSQEIRKKLIDFQC
ncbi:hypothetical protein KIN20_016067 [Parelaphostrongylus tenuis]|uniref:NTR domain-containing protein n=1 Tax=Parelaphostrongylus tenuis TaxID=148309 RepID=A0AAD5QQG6_PARTN|nr:hypothetical protein KIN20_016067 [Parelaphostrongylus tenuis]